MIGRLSIAFSLAMSLYTSLCQCHNRTNIFSSLTELQVCNQDSLYGEKSRCLIGSMGSAQGLSQYLKNACPKLQFQNFFPSRFNYYLYNTHLIAYCVKKGILHFSYVLGDCLLEKYLVITPQKSKLKILHLIFCLSKNEVFRKLPVQKTGWKGPG